MNWDPLSVTISYGTLRRQMMFLHTKLSTWASLILALDSASTHFEKKYVRTNRKRFCLELWRGLTISIDQRINGYGEEMDDSSSAG